MIVILVAAVILFWFLFLTKAGPRLPLVVNHYLKQGDDLYKSRRKLEAISAWQNALGWVDDKERMHISDSIHMMIGQCYAELGNYNQSAEHFNKGEP